MPKTLLRPLFLIPLALLLFVGAFATSYLIGARISQPDSSFFSVATSGAPAPSTTHISLYYADNQDFYPQSVSAFADLKPLANPPRIFLVNQHILAAHLIARQFALAADSSVKTVVLLTQNNWDAGQAPVITSREGWNTPLGDVLASLPLTDSLIAAGMANEDEQVFVHEHGITGIVPYVAHSFPNARIVPLVIRDKTADGILDALAARLEQVDLSSTVIVGSVDMSHYLPKYVADAHDRVTLQAIRQLDYAVLPRLDIDTAPTLRVLLKVAEHFGQTAFAQTGGANSADIVQDQSLLSTTSYIDGYFSRPEDAPAADAAVSSDDLSMLFVGDVMLDRGVATHADKYGAESLFGKLERLFLGTDLTLGNLEGTITRNQSVSIPNNSLLRFTFDPKYANALADLNFSGFSLSNNHALDFGQDGFAQTKRFLTAAGLFSYGSPLNDGALSAQVKIRGKNVCFVGYHELFRSDPAPIIKEIQRIRPQCDLVVLGAHWGQEYFPGVTDAQRERAHQFIDAGADLIIGGHPHVVEPLEIYKGKAIFYSLGNFMFDQDFSFNTEHGLAVNVEWGSDVARFTLVPVLIQRGEVSIADAADRKRTLALLLGGAHSTSSAASLPAAISSGIMEQYSFTLSH